MDLGYFVSNKGLENVPVLPVEWAYEDRRKILKHKKLLKDQDGSSQGNHTDLKSLLSLLNCIAVSKSK